MAHFALLWKARTIEKYRRNYENEKLNSIIKSKSDIPDKTLHQRWKHYSHDLHERLSRTFSRWYPEGSTVSTFFINLRAEMRFSNILLRSLFGFVGGLVLTYLCFVFLVFQLSLSLMHATILSSLFGTLITVGLTFSDRMRCLVFLLIPQLFSRAGRYTLTCYALVLILTGPATNIFRNSEILSESMACSQDHIKTTVREMNESMRKPFNSIMEYLKLMVAETKRIIALLRSSVVRINRLVLSIASIIQSSFAWLTMKAELCDKHLGTPYNRCLSTLNRGLDNTDVTWTNIAAVAKISCDMLRSYDTFCETSDFAEETFFATIKRKIITLNERLNKSMYFAITAQHSYSIVGNSSSGQVAAGIVTEIRSRADPILTWLSWSSCVTSLFLMLILFRAHHYQHMFETRSRFDNRYLTREFRTLDLARQREGRDTVLPLTSRERAKYVTTTSFRLVATEKTYLNRSAVFMMITTFKLLIHIIADYSLYWLLTTIRYHGSMERSFEDGNFKTGAFVSGKGFVSRLVQSLLDTLNIPLMPSKSSSKTCLPEPHAHDFKRYSQIGVLICFQWIFALFEPYGLRFRHLIVGHYHPDRAKARAVWLYNHILRHRASFMKLARRKLHREYKYYSKDYQTFSQWIRSLVPFYWLRRLLRIHVAEDPCVLCGAVEVHRQSNTDLIRCQVPSCPGTFCKSCFSDIGQMCTICMSPADYGDFSDVSLEMGSSNEESDSDDDSGGTSRNEIKKNITMEMEENISPFGNMDPGDSSEDSSSSKFDYETLPLLHHKGTFNVGDHDFKDCDDLKDSKNIHVEHIQILHQITIDVHVESYATRNPYVCYSFYDVSVHQHSICIYKDKTTSDIVKIYKYRKYTRQKKKSRKMKHEPFNTCNNNNGKFNQKIAKRDKKDKAVNECNKNKEHGNKKSSSVNKLNKIIKGNGRKKSKIKVTPCGTSHTLATRTSFQATWSKYWKNISSVLSCTKVKTEFHENEQYKHKRKKKPKESMEDTIRENNAARQYRILTYFADQDWKRNKLIKKIKDSFESQTKICEKDEEEISIIKIPKLNLSFSCDSLVNVDNKLVMRTNKMDRKTFDTRKESCYLNSASSTVLGLTERLFGKYAEEPYEPNEGENTELDINLPRSMRYFRSMDDVFDQLNHQDSYLKINENMKKAKQLANNSKTKKKEITTITKEKTRPENIAVATDNINKKHKKNSSKKDKMKPAVKTKISQSELNHMPKELINVNSPQCINEPKQPITQDKPRKRFLQLPRRSSWSFPKLHKKRTKETEEIESVAARVAVAAKAMTDGSSCEKVKTFEDQDGNAKIKIGIKIKSGDKRNGETESVKSVPDIKQKLEKGKVTFKSTSTDSESSTVSLTMQCSNKETQVKVKKKLPNARRKTGSCFCGFKWPLTLLRELYSNFCKEDDCDHPCPIYRPCDSCDPSYQQEDPWVYNKGGDEMCEETKIFDEINPRVDYIDVLKVEDEPRGIFCDFYKPKKDKKDKNIKESFLRRKLDEVKAKRSSGFTIREAEEIVKQAPKVEIQKDCKIFVGNKGTEMKPSEPEICKCSKKRADTKVFNPEEVPRFGTKRLTKIQRKKDTAISTKAVPVKRFRECATQTDPQGLFNANPQKVDKLLNASPQKVDKLLSTTQDKCVSADIEDKTKTSTQTEAHKQQQINIAPEGCVAIGEKEVPSNEEGTEIRDEQYFDPLCKQKPVFIPAPMCHPPLYVHPPYHKPTDSPQKPVCIQTTAHYDPEYGEDLIYEYPGMSFQPVERYNAKKYSRKKTVLACDAAVHAVLSTCTCATQHFTATKDACTVHDEHGSTRVFKDEISSNTKHNPDCEYITSHDRTTESSDLTFSKDSTESSSFSTDGKTDTTVTVCSMDYQRQRSAERKKLRIDVVTKSNQGTTTEKANLRDASTLTKDWWSPMVEKKDHGTNQCHQVEKIDHGIKKYHQVEKKDHGIKQFQVEKKYHGTNQCHQVEKKDHGTNQYHQVEKKDHGIKQCHQVEKKDHGTNQYPQVEMDKRRGKRLRDVGVKAEGRIVTFKSRTQIIPRESYGVINDILSPSRYLLESQKYYNEFFTSKYYSPHVFPMALKHLKLEQRSPVNSRQGRRSRISKRREDHPPKKLPTPRGRFR